MDKRIQGYMDHQRGGYTEEMFVDTMSMPIYPTGKAQKWEM
jgi:hypothetical protein